MKGPWHPAHSSWLFWCTLIPFLLCWTPRFNTTLGDEEDDGAPNKSSIEAPKAMLNDVPLGNPDDDDVSPEPHSVLSAHHHGY